MVLINYYELKCRMENSVDSDQLALYCFKWLTYLVCLLLWFKKEFIYSKFGAKLNSSCIYCSQGSVKGYVQCRGSFHPELRPNPNETKI